MIIKQAKFISMKNKVFFLALFAITFFLHRYHFLNSDEGVVLANAWGLFNGKELYSDMFDFVAPASSYTVFWLWKIFGPHYFVAKTFAILVLFFSATGIYKISRLFAQNKYSILAPLIFILSSALGPLINHNVFNLFFLIWCIYFILKGLSNNSPNDFIISGLLGGISLLFLQHKGLVLLFSIVTFLFFLFIKKRNREILENVFYFLICSLLPILILIIIWPINTLYHNLIIFPLFHYYEGDKPPPGLLILFLSVLALLTVVFRNEKNRNIWLILYVQFFLLLSTIPLADYYHILLILFPIYALLPLMFSKIRSKYTPFGKHLLYAIIFCILLISIVPTAINLFVLQKPNYNDLISFIEQNCQESQYLYAGPFIPGLYFETKKINPTPFSYLITKQHTKEQFKQAHDYLSKIRPGCAVLNYEIVEKFNYDKNNPVDNFIENNYKQIGEFGNCIIYIDTK